MTILLLAGSPSVPSRSSRLLHYAGDRLAELGHRNTQLNVRDLPAQALLHADFGNGDLKIALAQVKEASAVVIATPVYKAAYSGILKAFLDLLPQDGLNEKLVLPLATGGSQSHMLALDYGLRPVLSSLSARHVLPSVFATDKQVEWTSTEGLALAPEIGMRVNDAVIQLSAYLFNLQRQSPPSYAPVPFSQVRCSV